jgi:glycosyltransferase involved in cell wall biosynthesis
MIRRVLEVVRGVLKTAVLVASPTRLLENALNLGLWFRTTGDPAALKTWRVLFDPGYYVLTNPDVARSGIDPLIHFLLRGNAELRNPSERFDIGQYLLMNSDVARRRINGLLHFALYGREEGRIVNSAGPRIALERRATAAAAPPPHPDAAPTEDAGRCQIVVNDWLPGLPLVSVVIPCFNYGQFVGEAIRSALAQTFSNLEVIVVEGGSDDGSTVEHVKFLEAEDLPGLTTYYRKGRHLVGDNRNFGISRARGRYICCLDADDMLSPIYIETAVFLAEAFGYDIVCTSSRSFGELSFEWLLSDARFPEIASGNQISTTALFRRAAWAQVGGFRDWGLGDSYVPEDWDFWVRLLGHGFSSAVIREPLFQYRVHGNSLTSTSDMTLERQRRAINECNANLLSQSALTAGGQSPVKVVNRWGNLFEKDDDPRPGFLLALPFVSIGGAENLLYELAESVVADGYRLVVITSLTLPENIPNMWQRFTALTPHVYPLAQLFGDTGLHREFLFYLIRRYRVGCLFFAGCELVYHLLPEIAKEFPDLAVVDQIFNDKVHAPNNRLYRRHIHSTIVPSPAVESAFRSMNHEEQGTVGVIPHFVEIPLPEPRPPAQLRSDLSLPRTKVIVSFFGRLSPEKGADVFVEIARRLASDASLQFLMTGDGPERARIQDLIRRYGLESRVIAKGFVDDVRPFIQASDIVVVPSNLDGMPLIVLEAHAREKPVVASSVGSIPAMVADGRTGFLCPSGDVPAFCRRIRQLARNPSLRSSMGKAGRAGVIASHSRESCIQAYMGIFRQFRNGGC